MKRKPRMFVAGAVTAMAMTGLVAIGSGMVQQPAGGSVAANQTPHVVVQKAVAQTITGGQGN